MNIFPYFVFIFNATSPVFFSVHYYINICFFPVLSHFVLTSLLGEFNAKSASNILIIIIDLLMERMLF